MDSCKKKKVEIVSTLVKNTVYGEKAIGHLPDVVYSNKHESDGKSVFSIEEAINMTSSSYRIPACMCPVTFLSLQQTLIIS